MATAANADCKEGVGAEPAPTPAPAPKAGIGARRELNVLAEWTDVAWTPLPLDDVCRIEYDDHFRAVFGLLIAAQALPERAPRGLRLARAAVALNKAHVSAWRYRGECAEALNSEAVWRGELAATGALLRDSPKNYQAWEYRRRCVAALGAYQAEPGFVDVALADDAKNYHAWAHRQWLLRQTPAPSIADELAATEALLDNDVRNNSAWNHRALLLRAADAATLADEGRLALARLPPAPRNEALWNFLHALVRAGLNPADARVAAATAVEADPKCIGARRFLLRTAQQASDAVAQCVALQEVDPIRAKYWANRAAQWRRAEPQHVNTNKDNPPSPSSPSTPPAP